MSSEEKIEKQPIDGCDHRWKQIDYWDGKNMYTHKKIGGPKCKCIVCGGIRTFTWEEWYALPKEIKTKL